MKNYVWLQLIMTDYDRLWQITTIDYDRLWQIMTEYDRIGQIMTDYDRPKDDQLLWLPLVTSTEYSEAATGNL